MPFRETGIARGFAKFLGIWALVFAAAAVFLGDRLTSKQWTYLFSVPGGKVFWAILFGMGGLITLWGVYRTHYSSCATGLFLMGSGCGAVAMFYLLAPLIDRGLLTLGWVPWGLGVGVTYFFAIINWKPIPCF
jgi:hypothetical protein